MSDSEAVQEINKALENELEGIDYEAIADSRLKGLDREYAKTIASVVNPSVVFETTWEADFNDHGYQKISSDEEEVTEEIPQNPTRDLVLTEENKEKIKKIMAGIHIKVPNWAKNLPDSIFAEHLRAKILK